jgi:hypothetical protein
MMSPCFGKPFLGTPAKPPLATFGKPVLRIAKGKGEKVIHAP